MIFSWKKNIGLDLLLIFDEDFTAFPNYLIVSLSFIINISPNTSIEFSCNFPYFFLVIIPYYVNAENKIAPFLLCRAFYSFKAC